MELITLEKAQPRHINRYHSFGNLQNWLRQIRGITGEIIFPKLPGLKTLVLGAGYGSEPYYYAQQGARVTAVDYKRKIVPEFDQLFEFESSNFKDLQLMQHFDLISMCGSSGLYEMTKPELLDKALEHATPGATILWTFDEQPSISLAEIATRGCDIQYLGSPHAAIEYPYRYFDPWDKIVFILQAPSITNL